MKKLGISLIIISVLLFLILKIYLLCEYENHSKTIDRIFIKGEKIETNYIGYIEIESVNIKRGIVNGINDEILNNNDIGIIRDNNFVLAGHGVENVFGRLNKINIFDEVKIHLYDKDYYFIIYKKIIVSKDNLNYLNDDLVLITCTNDDKRLLVLGAKKPL
jgi:LPXTG-site transpeptidase (sortase) family protein